MAEPTFQDLLSDYSEDLFVGRADELALFERMITAGRPPCLILAISGQGGVGKTTLLERFRSMAGDRKVATAVADEGQLGVIEVLDHLAGQFGRDGVPFDTFMKRLQRYRELKQQIDADKGAPRGFLDFAARGAARMGMRAFKKHVPIAGDFADVMLSKEAEDRIAEEAGTFATYVAQKFKQRDDRNLVLDTTKELTGQFLIDLSMQAQYRRIVLFFDTYERTAPVLDGWLRDLLRGQYGDFHGNTRVVIAGRHPLGPQWTRFRGAVRQIELREFTEGEARLYLERSGIAERVAQDRFIELSNCLPVLLAFLVSTPDKVSAPVVGTAVECFLKGLTPNEHDAALLCSVPLRFNQDILRAVLAIDEADTAFDWLTKQPFVKATEQGWAYHHIVRAMLIQNLRHRSPARFARTHTQLAHLYESQAENLQAADQSHYANPLWWRVEIQALYHELSSDPERHLDAVLTALVNVLRSRSGFSQTGLLSFGALFEAVFEETGNQTLRVWRDSLAALVKADYISNPYEPEAILALDALLTLLSTRETLANSERSFAYWGAAAIAFRNQNPDRAITLVSEAIELSPNADAHHYRLRSRVHIQLENYGAALDDATKASELNPDAGDDSSLRSDIYFRIGDYSSALAAVSRAIELEPDKAFYYFSRGVTYLALQNWHAAVADFAKAIGLGAADGYSFRMRGMAYLFMKDHSAALVDFAKAIELDPDDARSYNGRGQAAFALQDFAGALVDFSEAIKLEPERGVNFYWRGNSRLALGDFFGALNDFSKAIELQPHSGRNYSMRGFTHFQQQDFGEALSNLSRAIEIEPEEGFLHYWLGRTHYELRDYAAALTHLSRSIELRPDDGDSYGWRGLTYYDLKDYPAALADLSKAIKLQPDDGDNYFLRGSTYYDLKDYPAALADFSKAIELQSDDGDNYFWHGRTYYELKDYPAALADFSRAIELQPANPYNYAWHGRGCAACGYAAAALSDLEHAQRMLDENGDAAYIAAAGYIQLDRLEDAIRMLRLAFERSPELLDDIAAEADFNPVRQTPEFQALLAEFDSYLSGSPRS